MVRLAMAQRRQLLIEAAWRVLSRDGVRAATTRAICAEAGMPQSSFHYCFESRSELLRIVVTSLVPLQMDWSMAELDGASSLERIALGPLRALWRDVEEHPMRHAVLYDITMTALYDPELRDLADFQYVEYHKAAATVLERAAEQLSFTWDEDIDVLAAEFIAFLDGLTLRYIVDRNSELANKAIERFAADLSQHAHPVAN